MSDETPPIPTGDLEPEEPEEAEVILTKEEKEWLQNQMRQKTKPDEGGQPVKTEIAVLKLEQPPIQSPLEPEPEPEKKPKSKKSKHANRKRVVNFRVSKD